MNDSFTKKTKNNCSKNTREFTKTVRFCNILIFSITFRNHRTSDSTIENPQSYFHTLLLIRNKATDFFVAAYLKLSAHTSAHNSLKPRANRSKVQMVPILVFLNELQRKIHINKNILLIKGTRIDRAFVYNFW